MVCVGGLAFPLIEANSPLYSLKMPQSHLPSLLGPVVEVLSSYVLKLVINLVKNVGYWKGEEMGATYSEAILTQKFKPYFN